MPPVASSPSREDGREKTALSARCGRRHCEKKGIHIDAQISEVRVSIAGGALRDKLRHDFFKRSIVIVQALEGDQRADERPCLAGFDTGRE